MSAEPQTHDAANPGPVGPPLGQHKAWLVAEGNRIGRLARDNRDWKSQIRVLQEAARKETEPRVLVNLLRYQAARNPNWLKERDVLTPMKTAMEQCIARAPGDEKLAIDLMQHLFLYTVRAFTYESSNKVPHLEGEGS